MQTKKCYYDERGQYLCFYDEKETRQFSAKEVKTARKERLEHLTRQERRERRQRHKKLRAGKKPSRPVYFRENEGAQ